MDDATLDPRADESQAPPAELGRILGQLEPVLGPLAEDLRPLDGGITNRNFRAALGEGDYVIRVPGKDTDLLGIDRRAELAANELAASLGIAPAVAAFIEDPPCIVTAFVEGRGMAAAELGSGDALAGVAAALRRLHDSGKELPSRFDSFEVVAAYARTASARGAQLPPEYPGALERAREIRASAGGPWRAPVPCHNDLLAANFLRAGGRMVIVDWEYAGMGDRFFDLANFAVSNGLDEAQQRAFLEAYCGQGAEEPRAADAALDDHLAALRRMMFMSDFREAMWGVVQDAVSDIDFDFAAYACEHFERMGRHAAG